MFASSPHGASTPSPFSTTDPLFLWQVSGIGRFPQPTLCDSWRSHHGFVNSCGTSRRLQKPAGTRPRGAICEAQSTRKKQTECACFQPSREQPGELCNVTLAGLGMHFLDKQILSPPIQCHLNIKGLSLRKHWVGRGILSPIAL